MESVLANDKIISIHEPGNGASGFLDDHYKIKISSKKLFSGRYQVKFYANVTEHKQLYGYVLVNAGEKITDVVDKIRHRLDRLTARDSFHHINLYTIGKREADDLNFIIFDA